MLVGVALPKRLLGLLVQRTNVARTDDAGVSEGPCDRLVPSFAMRPQASLAACRRPVKPSDPHQRRAARTQASRRRLVDDEPELDIPH